MVHLPVRKCYYLAKVTALLIIVVTILTLFEKWRGGNRSARAEYMDSMEVKYEAQILEDEERIVPGLGDGGAPAYLQGEEKKLGEESEKKLAINVYLSERIAYNRSLTDQRNPACARVTYDAELPSASVIIIFHNEPYSVVVRTLWSVINSVRREQPWHRNANHIDRQTGRLMTLGYPGQDPNSPLVYLKEIILVDDNSTLPELKGKLSHYIRTRLPPDLIRILRLPDRVGLTRARLAGARYAVGDVLVFLDAHCEAQPDWLRPLLHRIKDAPHAVLIPIIDVIESSTFYYSVMNPVSFQGLMLARTAGARAARGSALVFLDAHCEAQRDWLRPLLQRLKERRGAVLTPLIDVIDQSTFQLDAAQHFQVGGFTFMGHFTWIDVPEREKLRRGSDISPTWSPTMAGGLFAIDRRYYWELGAYDEQMAGWGGENLEMSFRVWQCGGTLETIPCSRVGHVFRSFHPYGMPADSDTHGINTARMAEVWMDEYAELFYMHRPDLRNNPKIGDVTHRKILREKLKCKSFQWYLDNIYKEKFVPVRDAYGFGRFSNAASGFCLDTLQREGEASPLGLYPCHATLQPTQYFCLSLHGQLRDEEKCVELQYVRDQTRDRTEGRRMLMVACHDDARKQRWRYLPSHQLQHVESGLCCDAGVTSGADVLAKPCRPHADSQLWDIDYTEDKEDWSIGSEAGDQQQRLQKLRGLRRISRSLMSAREEESQDTESRAQLAATERYNETRRRPHKKRKHKKRKHSKRKGKRIKNKFILKLVRNGANNTEDHLEVDISCKHRRLYPNNTFVRDLVTILNDKDIKVINNGRIFERNRVTELVKDPLTARHEESKVLEKMELNREPAPPGPFVEASNNRVTELVKGPQNVRQKMPPQKMNVGREPGPPAPGPVDELKHMRIKKHKNEKVGRQMPEPRPEYGAASLMAAASHMPAPPPLIDQKKIIIEDFVEVKRVSTELPVQGKRVGKKRRKRPHAGYPPTAPESYPPKAPADYAHTAFAGYPPKAAAGYPSKAAAGYAHTAHAGYSPAQPVSPPPAPARGERGPDALPPKQEPMTNNMGAMGQESTEQSDEASPEEWPMISSPPERQQARPQERQQARPRERVESHQQERERQQVREQARQIERLQSTQRERLRAQEGARQDRQSDRADSMQEEWLMGESRFRRTNGSHADGAVPPADTDGQVDPLTRMRGDSDTDTGSETNDIAARDTPQQLEPPRARPEDVSSQHDVPHYPTLAGGWVRDDALDLPGGGEPVKVVMKSNLTFNLGDEFFNWRTGPDVASLLNSLVLPARTAPPVLAWRRPDSEGAGGTVPRAGKLVQTGRAQALAPSSSDDDSSSSSASDSQGS